MDWGKTFSLFDKSSKGYLTKHELKLSMIYSFGFKPPTAILNEIWSKRFESKLVGSMRTIPIERLIIQGVTPEYFALVMDEYSKTANLEKVARAEFTVIDELDKGFLSFQDFEKLIKNNMTDFLGESKKRAIFREIDLDGDGKISYQDYLNFLKLTV